MMVVIKGCMNRGLKPSILLFFYFSRVPKLRFKALLLTLFSYSVYFFTIEPLTTEDFIRGSAAYMYRVRMTRQADHGLCAIHDSSSRINA